MPQVHQHSQLHSSSSHHQTTYSLSRQECPKCINTVSFIPAPATIRQLTPCPGKNAPSDCQYKWSRPLPYLGMRKPHCNVYLHLTASLFWKLPWPFTCFFDPQHEYSVMFKCQVDEGVKMPANDLSTAYLIQSLILVRCVDINSISKVSSPNALVVDTRSGAQSAWSLFISKIREVKLHAGELMGPLTSQSYIVLGRVSPST